MRISADTNLLVRVVLDDDPGQTARATAELRNASRVAICNVAFCELAWVLRQGARQNPPQIAAAIRQLASRPNVAIDREAVDAGCAMLDAGGDFADGVIDREGLRLGGAVLVSFDAKAIRRLTGLGRPARAPG